MAKKSMIWTPRDFRIPPARVEVLAVVGTNAMVRRPRCAAFVAHIKTLSEVVDYVD